MKPIYILKGVVKKNQGRGTSIGYPTANLTVKSDVEEGVYLGLAYHKNKAHKALLFVGVPLTFSDKQRRAETYILDFNETIYGETISIEVLKRLRDNKKFDSVSDLISQIKDDEKKAREYFGI